MEKKEIFPISAFGKLALWLVNKPPHQRIPRPEAKALRAY